MKRTYFLVLLSITFAISGMAFTRQNSTIARAGSLKDSNPPGPDRIVVITEKYTAYEWNMAYWKTQKSVCTMMVDHEGVPTTDEVYRDCGETIFDSWIQQKPCNEKYKHTCDGYYITQVDSYLEEKQTPSELEPATAWISIEDCEPVPSASTNICESQPVLVITGQEPLQDEHITRIAGTYGGQDFDCDGDTCKFQIIETPVEGIQVEFWAFSSYGDSSIKYTALVRAQKADKGDPDQYYWYADVLSSQWQGQATATCADIWNVFPPVGGPDEWLTTPKQSEQLSSDIPYTYLAANLIKQGLVKASTCPDGGVSGNGAANQCGLELARPAIVEWQNQFDGLILSTAEETAIPAHLLKNLFARESQFWPGLYNGAFDVGLGQMTENGADTTLFWNSNFFNEFCPLVLQKSDCEVGYMNLDESQQLQLRQALLQSVNATCENCPLGINLDQAGFSVAVFAHALTANCKQAAQVIQNYTGEAPEQVASYQDLWRFTLVNYNVGGGCLAAGISRAMGEPAPEGQVLPLTWDKVAPFFEGVCANAVDYVNDITRK